jgi:hypothetical protein
MNVVILPTAPKTFIQVRKGRRNWLVQIVTPCEGERPLCTTIASSPDAQSAIEYGRETAQRMQRPFKTSKAVRGVT